MNDFEPSELDNLNENNILPKDNGTPYSLRNRSGMAGSNNPIITIESPKIFRKMINVGLLGDFSTSDDDS